MKAIGVGASGIVIAAALGLLPLSAMAADSGANAQKQPTTVGEIVVTAQKRVQKLQDVPLSVSAITHEQLVQRNVTALVGLEYSVPGLSTVDYGPGINFVQIRGISNSIGSPTVGIYLDEMAVGGSYQQDTIDIRILDMDRIEVLRGPQGTLYGEGSMGGTIRYITNSPNLSAFSGNVEGEVNTVDGGGVGYKANGVVNLPIIKDVLGVRLLVADEKDAGWINDPVTGKRDANAADFETFRGKLLFEPTSHTQITLLALHQQMDQDYQNFGRIGVTHAATPPFNRNNYSLFNGVLNQDLGFANLVESLGYLDNHTKEAFDLTPFYLPLLEAPPPLGFGLAPGFINQIGYPDDLRSRIFTNETRLSSKGGTPFNWTVGFYYRDSDDKTNSATYTAPGTLPFTILKDNTDLKSKAWALFGEVNYRFTPHLLATIGLRYYDDQRNQVSDSISLGFPAHDVNSGTFHSFDPRFNLRYEFSPTSMVYVNVAKGFRSGGFNLTSAGGGVFIQIPSAYAPDSLWSYEAGTKEELFDHKLELQAAVYYEDWSNVQSYEFAPGSPITIIVNSGQVAGWGTDLQADWHATPDLDFSASYGWNNLAFGNTTADKDAGDPVDFAVHDSGSVSLDYHRPIGDDTAFFRLDYQYAGKSQITLRNFGNEINYNPARQTLNARIGVDIGRYELSLFATNLANDQAPIVVGPFGVIAEDVEQTPRTIGVNVKAHF